MAATSAHDALRYNPAGNVPPLLVNLDGGRTRQPLMSCILAQTGLGPARNPRGRG